MSEKFGFLHLFMTKLVFQLLTIPVSLIVTLNKNLQELILCRLSLNY